MNTPNSRQTDHAAGNRRYRRPVKQDLAEGRPVSEQGGEQSSSIFKRSRQRKLLGVDWSMVMMLAFICLCLLGPFALEMALHGNFNFGFSGGSSGGTQLSSSKRVDRSRSTARPQPAAREKRSESADREKRSESAAREKRSESADREKRSESADREKRSEEDAQPNKGLTAILSDLGTMRVLLAIVAVTGFIFFVYNLILAVREVKSLKSETRTG